MSSVAVIGAGAWGTALAIQAARAGNAVTLWARDPARAEAIVASRENPRLPGIRLPEPILATSAMPDDGRRGPAGGSHAASARRAGAPSDRPRAAGGLCQRRGADDAAPAAGDRRRRPARHAVGHPHRPELRPRDRRRTARRRRRRGQRRRPAHIDRRLARHTVLPALRQRRPDRRAGRRRGQERDRHRGRRGDRRRPRRERPCRPDHARPGRTVEAGRGAGGKGGDGDGAVGSRRSAADLHGPGKPQLQPRTGARPRRAACRRPGRTECRHRGCRHGARPRRTRRRPGSTPGASVDLPICAAVASLLAGRTTLAEAIAALLARPRRDE